LSFYESINISLSIFSRKNSKHRCKKIKESKSYVGQIQEFRENSGDTLLVRPGKVA